MLEPGKTTTWQCGFLWRMKLGERIEPEQGMGPAEASIAGSYAPLQAGLPNTGLCKSVPAK